MTKINEFNQNLLDSGYVQNLRAESEPQPIGENLARGYVAEATADVLLGLSAESQRFSATSSVNLDRGAESKQDRVGASAIGRIVAQGLVARAAKIYDDAEILAERTDEGWLRLRHDRRYLLVQGMENAIVDWSADSVSVDPAELRGECFNLLHEKGGLAVMVAGSALRVQTLTKNDQAWPSAAGVLKAIEADADLVAVLGSMPSGHPVKQGYLVALASKFADHVAKEIRVRQILDGALPVHQQQAMGWLFSLNEAQLNALELDAEIRARGISDVFKELQDYSVDDTYFRQRFAEAARERVEIGALASLFQLAGIETKKLSAYLADLDEDALDYAHVLPRLDALRDNLFLTRSAQWDENTWWSLALP